MTLPPSSVHFCAQYCATLPEPDTMTFLPSKLSFLERLYLYQAQVWYHYIRHDMLTCYKYVCRWIALFDR